MNKAQEELINIYKAIYNARPGQFFSELTAYITINIASDNDEVISDIADSITEYDLACVLFAPANDDSKLKKAKATIKHLQREAVYLACRLTNKS